MTEARSIPSSRLAGAWRAAAIIAADVRLAHTVFALPFALLGAVMAARPSGAPPVALAGPLVLVVAAMVTGRTWAMLANRWLDREIDARNPRTSGRALPSGRLSSRAAIVALGVLAALFVAIASGFGLLWGNWWPLLAAPAVLAWIGAYALLKRRSLLCHVYLGSSLAISPLAAALAIDPAALGSQPALWLLSLMVLAWVAGFDVIYALQDVAVDRRDGLHSMPARLGPGGAMAASRGLHLLALAALVAAARLDARLGLAFAVACALVGALLLVEHATVHRWGTTRLALSFFTINGVISVVLGAAGIADVLAATS